MTPVATERLPMRETYWMREIKRILQDRDETTRLLQACLRTMEAHGLADAPEAITTRDFIADRLFDPRAA
jgi:hypothetical protein